MRPALSERAVVLVGVLVVVVVLTLLAGTALVIADAEATAARGVLRREQARAIAWSGVQAAMAELGHQRESIMAGQAPQLTATWSLFGEATGPRGVVRLLELEPGRTVIPEAGKLDLNSAAASVLAASGAMDSAAAEAIVAARAQGPFGSVAEAMAQTPRPAAPTGVTSDARTEALEEAPAGPETKLTVFAFEPNTQRSADGAAGEPRLFIGDGWDDSLKTPLAEGLDEKTAAAVEKVLRGGAPASMGDVVAGLAREQVPLKDWASALDLLTITHDAYIAGRVDIHSAPRDVLRAVPGMNDAMAEQIERLRDRIDAESRLSVVWLVQQGVLTPAQFGVVIDHITSRCLQWRVRVEGGYAPPGQDPGAEPAAARDRVVLEAVIDLAGERPRLAFLSDVTYLEAAPLLEVVAADAGAERSETGLESAGDLRLDGGLPGVDLDLGATLTSDAGGDLDFAPMEMSGEVEADSSLDLSSGLELGREVGREGAGPAAAARAGSGTGVKEAGPVVDRRVGRWKIPSRPAGSGM